MWGTRLNAEDAEPFLPFIEDATSLQFALMRVMRLLQLGHSFEYKRYALLLYSLQIAASNLKNFKAEHPQLELPDKDLPESALPQQECAGGEQEKDAGKNGHDPTLARSLVGLLAKGPNGDSAGEASRIDTAAQYCAGVKRTQGTERTRSGQRSSLAAG